MTNTVYFSAIVRDDDSSSVTESTDGSQLDENNGVIQNRFKAKRVLFSAIGKAYASIAKSVHLAAAAASSSVDKTETKEVQTLTTKNVPNHVDAELLAAGWPCWLILHAREAIMGWVPRRADSFEKLDTIGQGHHSNVYKDRDVMMGKMVALKKVRFDSIKPESVQFAVRELVLLRRLDHPNVMKLEGLVTSRMSSSFYLVFEYIEHDLAHLAADTKIKLTEPQIKCYMRQLLLGLEHCHNRQVLHGDLKGSDLRLDNGLLKVADFGLTSFFDPHYKYPLTSWVVSLWYRAPELLLGATIYGVAVDLWSVGCILAELYYGRPIMSGRTEVEQLYKIYTLCGCPSERYWKYSKLPHHPYPRAIAETFKDFPPPLLSLLEILLAIDPADRQTATAALQSEYFSTEPYACEPSSFPQYIPRGDG